MREPIGLSEITKALIEDAHSDVMGLWAVLWQVKERIPTITPQEARRATLTVIAEALAKQAVVAGDFADQDEEMAVFVPWSLRADETIARIQREWDALGREPNLGEIVWFVDPQILPVSVSKHPMGKEWRPGPA